VRDISYVPQLYRTPASPPDRPLTRLVFKQLTANTDIH
jgi:hypothetical protein